MLFLHRKCMLYSYIYLPLQKSIDSDFYCNRIIPPALARRKRVVKVKIKSRVKQLYSSCISRQKKKRRRIPSLSALITSLYLLVARKTPIHSSDHVPYIYTSANPSCIRFSRKNYSLFSLVKAVSHRNKRKELWRNTCSLFSV